MRTARAVAMTTLALTLAITAGAGAGPRTILKTCPAHHFRTLAHAGSVRVIVDLGHTTLGRHAIIGCSGTHGVQLGLILAQPEDENDHVIRALVTGHQTALVQNQFASDGDGQVEVTVANVIRRRVLVQTDASPDVDGVTQAVLGANGTLAFRVSTGALRAAYQGSMESGCVFDPGPVDDGSLMQSGTALTWTGGGMNHAAPLSAAGCMP